MNNPVSKLNKYYLPSGNAQRFESGDSFRGVRGRFVVVAIFVFLQEHLSHSSGIDAPFTKFLDIKKSINIFNISMS